MANKDAIRFVRNLTASFSRWKIPDETKEAYVGQLSKWRLTEDEWSAALSRIVADYEDLPTLAQIYPYLKIQKARTSDGSDLGWLTFLGSGKPYAVRIRSVGGQWVFARMVFIRGNGEKIELQKHVGEPAVAPEWATEIRYLPDHPAEEQVGNHAPEMAAMVEKIGMPFYPDFER